MTDLAEFLSARLDEDEAAATAALPGPWMTGAVAEHLVSNVVYGQSRDWPGHIVQVCNVDYGHNKVADSVHIARHDPARVLRDIAAKRAILGEQTSDHAPIESVYGLTCRTCVAWQDDEGVHEFGIAIPEAWPCRVARSAAAVYSDHPDYRPEWKP